MKAFLQLLPVVTEKNHGNFRVADDGQGSNITFNQNYNLQKEKTILLSPVRTQKLLTIPIQKHLTTRTKNRVWCIL